MADLGAKAVVGAAANAVLADAKRADDVPSAAHVPAAEGIARRDARKGQPKSRAHLKVVARKYVLPKATRQRGVTQKDVAKSVARVGRTVIVLREAIAPKEGVAQKADIARSGVSSGPKVAPVIDRGLGDLRTRAVHPSEVHTDPRRAPPHRPPTRSMTSAPACWKPAPPPRSTKTVTKSSPANRSPANRTAANMVDANHTASIVPHRAVMSHATPASTVSMTAATGSAPKVAARLRNLGKRLTSSRIVRKHPRLRPRNPPMKVDVHPAGAVDGDVRARGESDRQDRWIGRRQ
ncbi:MAG TPA: hypothetical protein VG457_04830 [Planctomycetota bacterium]|nr:hypothetical protein [Planctomycetota bacterium]